MYRPGYRPQLPPERLRPPNLVADTDVDGRPPSQREPPSSTSNRVRDPRERKSVPCHGEGATTVDQPAPTTTDRHLVINSSAASTTRIGCCGSCAHWMRLASAFTSSSRNRPPASPSSRLERGGFSY